MLESAGKSNHRDNVSALGTTVGRTRQFGGRLVVLFQMLQELLHA